MIIKLPEYVDDLQSIAKNGLPSGFSTGLKGLDEFYRPDLGYMTVITGIPSHGKSEMCDQFFVNMARLHDWRFAVYSPENFPVALHSIKLVEKHVGQHYPKINATQKAAAHRWVDEHFTFIYPDEDHSTLPDVLDLFRQTQVDHGCNGIIIDPWNEIDHRRPPGLTESEYISQSLTKVRRFGRENKIHCWVVAHPTKLRKNDEGEYDPPTPYDISGAAHWYNKADFCLTVHRYDKSTTEVSVLVHKVKFKHFGKNGEATLNYIYHCGRVVDGAGNYSEETGDLPYE